MKLLVCTQLRHPPNPRSCGNSGSRTTAAQLEETIRRAGLPVTVEQSACMSMCINGPNVRLMPAGKTWHRVNEEAIAEVVTFLQAITN
ncbi:MAG: (2Fe-2S) ferredoxin domain-containing protein [Methylocystis sp.]|uniref:(2Fe-2S) ferredoxin domain-containing protein n=1 Tax=Methylocystis sp. TaxID=1911079 RepID=UPI003DA29DE9